MSRLKPVYVCQICKAIYRHDESRSNGSLEYFVSSLILVHSFLDVSSPPLVHSEHLFHSTAWFTLLHCFIHFNDSL